MGEMHGYRTGCKQVTKPFEMGAIEGLNGLLHVVTNSEHLKKCPKCWLFSIVTNQAWVHIFRWLMDAVLVLFGFLHIHHLNAIMIPSSCMSLETKTYWHSRNIFKLNNTYVHVWNLFILINGDFLKTYDLPVVQASYTVDEIEWQGCEMLTYNSGLQHSC